MALPLKSLPTGGWIKPEALRSAVALLVEVQDFKHQVPTKNGPKDTAYVDITVFGDKAALTAGEPNEVQRGIKVEQTVLARDCAQVGVGGAFVATMALGEAKNGNNAPWLWREVKDRSIIDAIVAYADKRDAKVAEAKASAPSFD